MFASAMIVLLVGITADMGRAQEGPSVVVHFEQGGSFLSAEDKSKLQALFCSHVVGPRSRVFILGYTDAAGDAGGNHRLSRKRAQSVRREIISAFGIDATIVMATGRGAENPVADNRQAQGRALNRRAEIYLANAPARKPHHVYGSQDPCRPAIQNLVEEAETLIRQQQFNAAILKLDRARALGGDHYSDWHTAYGLAGYYAHAPNGGIKAHFAAAVRLDPYNFKAREYLSRVQARQNVAAGEISPRMGLTLETAIAVTAAAQAYEYLRLFGVEPLARRELEHQPVDVWECLDADGRPVVYYFNRAGTYAWAFARRHGAAAATDPTAPVNRDGTASQPAAVAPTEPAAANAPPQIWDSRVFK